MSATAQTTTAQKTNTPTSAGALAPQSRSSSAAKDLVRGIDGFEAQEAVVMGFREGEKAPPAEGMVTTTSVNDHDNDYERSRMGGKRTTKTVTKREGDTSPDADHTTVTDTASRSRGLDYSVARGSKTEIKEGDKKTAHARSEKTSIGKGGISYSTSESTSDTTGAGTLDEESSSGSRAASVSVSGSGITQSETVAHEETDGSGESRTRSRSLERGDGKIGITGKSSTERTDSAGNETTREGTDKRGVVAGKDGYGVYGESERSIEHQRANGLKAGAVGGLDGNVTCNVTPIEGTEPPQYQISVTVKLGAKGNVSGGVEKGGVDASVELAGAASITMRTTKKLEGAAAKAYVDRITSASGGSVSGSEQELAIIATGVTQGWGAARAMYDGVRAQVGNPEATAAMAEGDKHELSTETEAGITGKGSIDAGVFAFGGEYGETTTTSDERSMEKKEGGVIEAKRSITETDKDSTGLTVGVGGIKGGASFGTSEKYGVGNTFELNPDDPAFGQMQTELAACKSPQELADFAQRWPQAVKDTTTTTGHGSTQKGNIALGKVASADVGFDASFEESATEDKTGKVTGRTMKGTNSGGIGIGMFGVNIKASSRETATATVDKDGKASMDLSETRTDTDVNAVLSSLPGMGDKKDPSEQPGMLAKVAGGAEKPDTTTQRTEGTLMDDADLHALAAAAQDPDTWNDRCPSPRLRADWIAAGAQLRRAGGDSTKIARALTSFVGKDGHGRDEVLNAAIRGNGGTGGGARYELPPGLAHLKPTYKALIMGDVMATIMKAPVTDKGDKSLEVAQGIINQLDQLMASMLSARDSFESAAIHGEMMSRVQVKKAEVVAKMRELTGRTGPETRQEAAARYNDLLTICQAMKSQELSIYDAMAVEDTGLGGVIKNVGRVNELRALYPQWTKKYEEMADLARAQGFGAEIYFKYKPDLERLERAKLGAPGPASEMKPDPKKEAAPVIKRAAKDPVGDSRRAVDAAAEQSAKGIRLQVPSARNRAHGSGNRLFAWIGQERNAVAVDAHNRGMSKLHNAERLFAKLSGKATTEDWQSYGFAAVQDYEAAMACFQEGLAKYAAGWPGAAKAA